MNNHSKELFSNSFIISKSRSDVVMRKRIQNSYFTKLIKNKIFKGYNKIKLVNSKNFNLKCFLSKKPEEKYLPTNEQYSIFYENKYLGKYNTDNKNFSLLLKNSIINEKGKNRKSLPNSEVAFPSDYEIRKTNLPNTQRVKRPFPALNVINNNKIKANNGRKIFQNRREESTFSDYPFVIFNKLPDNINNPKDLKNYPYYNPKFRQKNKEQQSFLFTLSHPIEKKIKNQYRCFSSRIIHKNKNKHINRSYINNDKYKLVSFYYSDKKDKNYELKRLINSIKTDKFKKLIIKQNLANLIKYK